MYVDSEGNEDLSTVYTINKVYKSDPTIDEKRKKERRKKFIDRVFYSAFAGVCLMWATVGLLNHRSNSAEKTEQVQPVCVCECVSSDYSDSSDLTK